jgi:hypothetical protein
MGTFVGFCQIINYFSKVTKDSTHLHNDKIMNYTHPKVIPWGWTNKWMDKWRDGQTDRQTNGQIFTQYSGMSSHSLRGVRIYNLVQLFLFEVKTAVTIPKLIQGICIS